MEDGTNEDADVEYIQNLHDGITGYTRAIATSKSSEENKALFAAAYELACSAENNRQVVATSLYIIELGLAALQTRLTQLSLRAAFYEEEAEALLQQKLTIEKAILEGFALAAIYSCWLANH